MVERQMEEVFPPGDVIKEELEARGWTQIDFAEIIGKSARLVNEVIAGKRAVTPDTARALADAFAFGTCAQLTRVTFRKRNYEHVCKRRWWI